MITLTDTQNKLIDIFKEIGLSKTFYWTGGTLLSIYYLQHRYSLDLDFFSETPFSYEIILPFIHRIKKKLAIEEIEQHKIYDRWDFIINKPQLTRFEFVYYNHEKKRLKPLRQYMGISIDSIEDIAANKTMAYFDRNEPKDLFDLYYLITKSKFTVSVLLALVKQKFDVSFSEFMFWGESAKSLKLLHSLQPLIPEPDTVKKKALIQSIRKFFLEKGIAYLRTKLE